MMNRLPWLLAAIAIALAVALHAPRPGVAQPADRADYEYRVMSLAQMFADAPNPDAMREKIAAMMVRVGQGVTRTDMDAADYQEALNRLALDDWEPVTVTKSNYWVFRRPVMQ